MRRPKKISANSRAESSRFGLFFFGGSSSSRIVTVTRRRFVIGSPQQVPVNGVSKPVRPSPHEESRPQVSDCDLAGITLQSLTDNPLGITSCSVDAHWILAGYFETERLFARENEALAGHELLDIGAVRHECDEAPTTKAEQSKEEKQGFHRVGSIARRERAVV